MMMMMNSCLLSFIPKGYADVTKETRTEREPQAEEEGTVHVWTDGSYRMCAGAGWIMTHDSHGTVSHWRGNDSDAIIHRGSATIGPNQTAFHAEVAAIERATRWLAGNRLHVTVHSDSTSAIARCQHVGASPGQSQANRIAHHIDRLLNDGVTANIQWVKDHGGTQGNEESRRPCRASR